MGKTILVILLECIHAPKKVVSKVWLRKKQNKTKHLVFLEEEKREVRLYNFVFRLLKDDTWVSHTTIITFIEHFLCTGTVLNTLNVNFQNNPET